MARIFKRHCDQCGEYYEGFGRKYCKPECGNEAKIKPEIPLRKPDALDPNKWPMPVTPVTVHVVTRKTIPKKSNTHHSIHFSDIHFPHHDPVALDIVYGVMEDVQPEVVCDQGDTLDCYQISRYEKDPKHRVSLQDEIELAAAHFGTINSIVPNAEKHWFPGNHEDRLRRILWDMAKDLPSRQVLNLPGIWEALSWESLLGLKDLGWRIHEDRWILYDKLVLKHGTAVRKWAGYSAKAEYERYGKSGMSGHTHRRGVFEHRDFNGQHAWWELGCLCDLDPVYMSDPDWAQGFNVVTWNEDRTAFGVEEVRIHTGLAIFRGKSYGQRKAA